MIYKKAKCIKFLMMDVDVVLTDGKVIYNDSGVRDKDVQCKRWNGN